MGRSPRSLPTRRALGLCLFFDRLHFVNEFFIVVIDKGIPKQTLKLLDVLDAACVRNYRGAHHAKPHRDARTIARKVASHDRYVADVLVESNNGVVCVAVRFEPLTSNRCHAARSFLATLSAGLCDSLITRSSSS